MPTSVGASRGHLCDSTSFLLSVRSESTGRPPGEPDRAPFAVKVEGTSVSLEWTPPEDNGGHPVTSYVIKYCPTLAAGSIADGYVTQRVDGATTSKCFQGQLAPETSYRFAVAAVNKVGDGDWSKFSEPIKTKTGI